VYQVLALTEFDDTSRPYERDTYYCRPGYRYTQSLDTNLLVTCRRVYAEAYLVPVAANEHVFWCYRGPPNTPSDYEAYFLRLSLKQRDAVQRVDFFTQLYWFRSSFPSVCNLKVVRPRSITVTVRHSDWWYWEQNTKLRMEKDWGRNLKELVGLKELVIEIVSP